MIEFRKQKIKNFHNHIIIQKLTEVNRKTVKKVQFFLNQNIVTACFSSSLYISSNL